METKKEDATKEREWRRSGLVMGFMVFEEFGGILWAGNGPGYNGSGPAASGDTTSTTIRG
jgi:hypothetical protein